MNKASCFPDGFGPTKRNELEVTSRASQSLPVHSARLHTHFSFLHTLFDSLTLTPRRSSRIAVHDRINCALLQPFIAQMSNQLRVGVLTSNSQGRTDRPPMTALSQHTNLQLFLAPLQVSDTASVDSASDTSGPSLCRLLEAESRYTVQTTAIVPDDFKTIQKTVTAWCDDLDLHLVLTTGGTGFGVRDCTPEVSEAGRYKLGRMEYRYPSILRYFNMTICSF